MTPDTDNFIPNDFVREHLWTRKQFADNYELSRSQAAHITKKPGFPGPTNIKLPIPGGRTCPTWERWRIQQWMETYKRQHVAPLRDGVDDLRPHRASLSITTEERTHLEAHYGSAGRGLRFILNKEMIQKEQNANRQAS